MMLYHALVLCTLSFSAAWTPRTGTVSVAPQIQMPTARSTLPTQREVTTWRPQSNLGFRSQSYQDLWNNRQGMWDRQGSIGERNVSGNSREYFATDPLAPATEIVLHNMDGRPLQADVELFDGPDNTPVRIKAYSENGRLTPVRDIVANEARNLGMRGFQQGGSSSYTVSARNTGTIEFPFLARVQPTAQRPFVQDRQGGTEIQGESRRTWTLPPLATRSCAVTLSSPSGMPVEADIQLWGVSNHVSQQIQVYQQDGLRYPTSLIIDTEQCNVIAVRNSGPLTFPIVVTVEPYEIYDRNEWASLYGRGGYRSNSNRYGNSNASGSYRPVDRSNGRNRYMDRASGPFSFSSESDYTPANPYMRVY